MNFFIGVSQSLLKILIERFLVRLGQHLPEHLRFVVSNAIEDVLDRTIGRLRHTAKPLTKQSRAIHDAGKDKAANQQHAADDHADLRTLALGGRGALKLRGGRGGTAAGWQRGILLRCGRWCTHNC